MKVEKMVVPLGVYILVGATQVSTLSRMKYGKGYGSV